MAKICPTCNGLVPEPLDVEHSDDGGEHWCDCAAVDARAELDDDE
jgi:hypothetical protein